MGRQGVVGAAGIVACTLAGIGSQEYASSIDYPFAQLFVVARLDDQMLRSIAVAECHHLVLILHQHIAAVLHSLGGNLLARQQCQLAVEFLVNLVQLLLVGGDEEHLRVDAVFSLRQQVGSHELGTGRLVGQHTYLRRTGRHVDGHLVQAHMLLGSHHILIARTEYLVHLGHALRTIGHGTNSLHTAYLEYLAHSGNACSHQYRRVHLALAVGRGAEHNLLASGNLGRSGQHQHGREEWGRAAGDIESDALDGYALLPAGDTFLCLHLLTDKTL